MRRTILLLLWMVAFAALAKAQGLQGAVVDEHQQPISDVTVILVGINNQTVGYTLTDEQGAFTLSLPQDTTNLKLMFRALGYKNVNIPIGQYRNRRQVTLVSSSIQLKEVNVRGHKIIQRGDTINYLVDGFRQAQDRTIADVIAKMPGLEVKPTRQITFEGKPINKFYIEGMDLMGSKYAQASENLSADKVKSVQVLQNHQPVKSLSHVEYSDVAALNIRLTDDAKNVWAGVVDAGVGLSSGTASDGLYSGKLMSMLFGKKQQNISMYKVDNSGKDIAHEVNVLTRESVDDQEETGLLCNLSAIAPDLGGKRTTFNTSHLVSTNHLFRTKNDNDLRFQMSYLWNRIRGDMHRETSYNDLEGTVFSEDDEATAIEHNVNGEIRYEVNKDKMYILNRVNSNLNFDRSNGVTTLNGKNIRQQVRPRRHHITEDFRMIIPIAHGRSLRIGSQTTYNYLPGRILTCEGEDEQLKMSTIESHNHIAFSHKLRNFNIAYQAGGRILYQRMHVARDTTDGRERFTQQDIYLQTTMNYAYHDLKAKAELKADGQHSAFTGNSKFHLMLLPSLSLRYELTAMSSLTANYKYTERSNAISDLFRTPTYTSYYIYKSNSGQMDYRGSQVLTLAWSYKQPLKGNFLDVAASWQRQDHLVLFRSIHQGNTLLREATGQRYAANGYHVSGRVAHSFSWAKAFLSLSTQYSQQQFHLLIANYQEPCTLHNTATQLKFSMQPADFFSCELNSRLSTSQQKSRLNNTSFNDNDIKNAANSLAMFFFPSKSIEIGCSNEWYLNSAEQTTNCYFLDANVAYRTKRFEINFEMFNLLNRNTYENRVVTTTTSTYTLYTLRPREALLGLTWNF